MYFLSRQDEKREISQISPRYNDGGQMEYDIKTRQTLHEIF